MSLKNTIGIFFVVLFFLFSAGCGAGTVSQDPPLPWEVTQDPVIGAPPEATQALVNDPPPDATQAIQPSLTQESPVQTATLAANDFPTATTSPSETSPAFTATASYTPTQTLNNTPTYTPSYTPTYTPSYTPTYTPTITPTITPSYTPTQTQAGQVAPADSNFNNPLNIPLDNTVSVTDFVSYPGGDTTDRVRFDVTGMNQNPSLSGGQARLVIAVSCFGTGTQNIRIYTGGQTFSCGQTLVDQDITYNTRTGTITIEAFSGTNTYVQWVLTGTATRTN